MQSRIVRPMRPWRTGFAALLLAASCNSVEVPDLNELYSEAAMVHDERRNPVILIPGILGSRLRESETGQLVWGAFDGDAADPSTAEGARLIALPMEEGRELHELRDTVANDGALDRVRVRFLGLPLVLNAYRQILATLGVGGYRDEQLGVAGAIDYGDDHFTCFQFDYDWRRDLTENAALLHAFILEKRAYVREEMRARYGAEDPDVQFDIVAHSMGGLLTRYYLRYGDAGVTADGTDPELTWAGAEFVERAILVATPNAGSAQAVIDATCGVDFGFFLPTYSAAVLGTMPAVYQLLPRGRHGAVRDGRTGERLDPFALELWERLEWGLLDPDEDDELQRLLPEAASRDERLRIARDHLSKCLPRASAVARALDRPAKTPDELELFLFAGDAKDTPSVLHTDERGEVRVAELSAGDDTVLRSSALMDERSAESWGPRLVSPIDWSQVFFLFQDHIGLTKDPTFTDNVLYLLLEDPR